MSEPIEIRITDKVDPKIAEKIGKIKERSLEADIALKNLQAELKKVGIQNGLQRLETELKKTALVQQKLQTELNKTSKAWIDSEAALSRAIVAENKAKASINNLAASKANLAIQSQRLTREQERANKAWIDSEAALSRAMVANNQVAVSQQRLATEQAKTAKSSQQLATEQARTATATVKTTIATQQLATAQTKSQTAVIGQQISQQNLSTAVVKTNNAQIQGTKIAQQLATAQQQTAVQTANAAAASNRAALAALRLANAQQKAAKPVVQAPSFSLKGALATAGASVGTGLGASAVVKIADSYTLMQNRLSTVTDSQGQLNNLLDRLQVLSNDTRSAVDETVSSFSRFDRALVNSGKSQEEVLRMTETINKALFISGTNSNEAAAAILQLSQAFNAGRLQGDEFRSISENMPIVLKGVAKAMNEPISNIKDLSREGKITSKVLFDAFKSIEKDVDSTFSRMNPTVEQSMVVFKNNIIKTIGEIDKKFGITKNISKFVLFLSENMGVLAKSISVVGISLIAAFGPKAIASISSLFALLAANPVILLAAGIAAAVSALILFSDKIKISSDGITTLMDVSIVAFEYIKGFFDELVYVAKGISIAYEELSKGNVDEKIKERNSKILSDLKDVANYIIASFHSSYQAVVLIFDHFPEAIKIPFTNAANFAIETAEIILNSWTDVVKGLIELLKPLAPSIASSMQGAVDNLKITLPRVSFNSKEADDVAIEIDKIFSKAFSKDYVGDAASALLKKAQENAKKRLHYEKATSPLRGVGEDTVTSKLDKEAAKSAEKRADALAKINLQLDNELARLFVLQPAREAQARMDTIEQNLASKKISLNDAEKDSIKNKIVAIEKAQEVQSKFDSIYQEAIAPLKDYNNTLEASNKLLAMGAITKQDYERVILKSSEAYKNSIDPLREFNLQLNEELRLSKIIPQLRGRETQISSILNQKRAEGIKLGENEINQLRSKIDLLEERNIIAQNEDQIYQETQKAQQSLQLKIEAIDNSFKNGIITLEEYQKRIIQTNLELSNLKLTIGDASFFDFLKVSFGSIISDYQSLAKGLSDTFGNFFKNFTDGFANSIGRAIVYSENLKDSLGNVAKEAVAGLISSLVKLGIQQVIVAAQTTSSVTAAIAAQTTASIAAASAVASAWAPAASLVSLASFGANATPAIAGISATNALASGIALSSFKGFEEGGWTGPGAKNKVAGFVHADEFVMNAATTDRIGVHNLQALQDGSASVQKGNRNDSGITLNGDIVIPISLPSGTTKAEAQEVGAAVAEGAIKQMRKLKMLEKESKFNGVK